jgi:hypothetical protein
MPHPLTGTRGSITAWTATPPISAAALVAATITESAAAVVLPRLGPVDRHPTTADLPFMQAVYRRLGLAIAGHLHEAEALAAAAAAVSHDFRAVDGSELREQLMELFVAYLLV